MAGVFLPSILLLCEEMMQSHHYGSPNQQRNDLYQDFKNNVLGIATNV